jgi:glycolate oxidase FAD binding subunit
MADIAAQLQERVRAAVADRQPLRLHGGDSKAFFGNPVQGEPLDLSGHSGIVSHEPTELVLTARAGTPLLEIEQRLAEQGQMLSFEPPHFAGGATLGGAVASGLGGPRRPWGGAPRDLVLGTRVLDGEGRILGFGGQVMKNVAGYDVSRLLAGSLGTLGVLLEVSVKVLPAPQLTRTLILQSDRDQAVTRMRELARQPVPLSGACHLHDRLYLRLSGSEASIRAWTRRIGGEVAAEHNTFWQRLRDHQLDFFQRDRPLWRLSLAAATPRLACEQEVLTDWAGAQRWVYTDLPADKVRAELAQHKGHAQLFRNAGTSACFQDLAPLMLTLHRRLRQRFDPHGIFNPGRIFDD